MPPPPVWSGNLTFSLVSVPVRMLAATRSHRVAFRQIHREDRGFVRNQRRCEVDGEVLDLADIGRAYETRDGTLVPITDSELDRMPLPTARTIEVDGFVDLAALDSIVFDTPYFLAPAAAAANKPYVLLREALARSGKAAVGKWAPRGAGEALGVLYPVGEVLVAHRLRWADEVRDAPTVRDADVSEEEVDAAVALIDALGTADLASYRDS